jgi:hypothetical protein
MGADIEYLFRGTTVGFSGSVFPRVGLTSTSVDPVVATLFAAVASKFGQAVVQIIPVARFSGRMRDNQPSTPLAGLEGEFVIEATPEVISDCATSISLDLAKSVLERIGVVFPLNIYNLPDLSAALRLTKRLNHEQILEFVRAVERHPC